MLDALPDALSTPELNIALRRGRAARADREAAGTTHASPAHRDVIRIDGLRVEYPDGFGLARASNTTPVIVLRFEADDRGGAGADPARVPPRARLRAKPGVELPFA